MTRLLFVFLLCVVPGQERVAFVGDSHMQVIGPMMTRTFADEGYEPVGFIARQGWSTRRYMARNDLADELRQLRPDVVVVQLGSNDYGIRSPDRYRPRLQWVIDAAHQAGASRVIWLGPPAGDPEASDLAARVSANHDRIAELQRQILPPMDCVTWVDSRPFTREHVRGDGYHLTRRGYEEWAQHAAETP